MLSVVVMLDAFLRLHMQATQASQMMQRHAGELLMFWTPRNVDQSCHVVPAMSAMGEPRRLESERISRCSFKVFLTATAVATL